MLIHSFSLKIMIRKILFPTCLIITKFMTEVEN